MTEICSIHHASLIVSSVEASRFFYHELLGLDIAERPDLPFPGIWLKIGEQQLHLLELPNPDPVDGRPEHGGRDRHLALLVHDLERLAEALDQAGVLFTRSKSGRAALFCRDPDGNALEFIQI